MPGENVSREIALDGSKAEEVEDKDKREIGRDAVWTLSTAKPGNGVEQLRDNNTDTYWQSDGPQPHLVNIQFHKKVSIKEIGIYCDFKQDESYTPSKISIRAGTHFHDLQEVEEVMLEEPCGWLTVPLTRKDLSPSEDDTEPMRDSCLRAFMVQIAVLANHENGRDSHIRQIKIFGPRLDPTAHVDAAGASDMHQSSLLLDAGAGFSSLDFSMYSSVR